MSPDYIAARILLFMHGDLSVWQHEDRYYIYHDVGTICQIIRRDLITESEAKLASQSLADAMGVLDVVRKRLEQDDVNAYSPNLSPDAPEWKDPKQFMQI